MIWMLSGSGRATLLGHLTVVRAPCRGEFQAYGFIHSASRVSSRCPSRHVWLQYAFTNLE